MTHKDWDDPPEIEITLGLLIFLTMVIIFAVLI